MTSLRVRESSIIAAVQRTRFAHGYLPIARALSLFGEHAAGWIVLGLLGAVLDSGRLWSWLLCTLAIVGAHGASVVIKRFVRRPRPAGEGVNVLGKAPSKLSFPSSHASSTAAAAFVFTLMLPGLWPLAVLVALAMGMARIVLGMHFPTDVLAGYALGVCAGVVTALLLPLL
ncbi:phosphatase PAP2 family protein [Microbacteriaceae bacterium VKM Ac-2854]|nr:phosphatase PAP2 family protein [Microbacteriaceae bacterium VKM Ac-2854]